MAWEELPEVAPEDFTVASMPARFASVGDLHAAIDDAHHSLQPLLDHYERQGDGDIGPVVPPPSAPVIRRGAKKLPQS